jgi:hypothetical protein
MIVMTEAEGAKTSIYVATAPELDGVTGRFFDKVREAKPSRASANEQAARRLWDQSQKLIDAVIG